MTTEIRASGTSQDKDALHSQETEERVDPVLESALPSQESWSFPPMSEDTAGFFQFLIEWWDAGMQGRLPWQQRNVQDGRP